MLNKFDLPRIPPDAAAEKIGFGRPAVFFLLLLFLAWIWPGLIGHDPWKPDEAYSFGLVYHIIQSGDWVVPTLAGEPFMEKPPLFYITAALFAKLFFPLLPLHDGARLAGGFYMAITLLFTGLAGRELRGKGRGFPAALILIGCLGLLIAAHALITDLALLAGFAIAFYGLALSLRRELIAGFLLGTGIGIGFMSKGLVEPGILGTTALLLPTLFKPWRNRRYLVCLAVAVVSTLPWLIIWPFALYQRSPVLFMEWFWLNNIGRLVGFAHLGTESLPGDILQTLPWFAWPALPLALWTLWRERRAIANKPAVQLTFTALVILLTVLGLSAEGRDIYALPLLLPLCYLGADAIFTMRRGAANAFHWFGVMVFFFFAAAIWFYWIAVEFGVPAQLSTHLKKLQPGYTPVLQPITLMLGLLYTLAWLALVFKLKRRPERPLIIWSAGMTMVWGLLMILFVSWLDAGKSYRSMTLSLQRALPAQYNCIASQGLGEPQRAMLHYFAGIITQRIERDGGNSCELFLIQANAKEPAQDHGTNWRPIWEGNRPGDKLERYRLYQQVRKRTSKPRRRA